MIPARRAPSTCSAKRARCGPCCRSLGHTRNTKGLMPLKSGLEAEGEIMTTGVAPAPYTRAAASVVPEERWPITATDRKSTRLNSSHLVISYAVFCLKKKRVLGHEPPNRQLAGTERANAR